MVVGVFNDSDVSKLYGYGPLLLRVAVAVLDLDKLAVDVGFDLDLIAGSVRALFTLHVAKQKCVVSAAEVRWRRP
jgi:hypothetical protein